MPASETKVGKAASGFAVDGPMRHVDTVQSLSGPGAVDVTSSITQFTSTGTGDALTMVDGQEGQKKTVVYLAEGGGADTGILTPTNLAGASTTITFNAIGDSADLLFTGGSWFFLGGAAVVA